MRSQKMRGLDGYLYATRNVKAMDARDSKTTMKTRDLNARLQLRCVRRNSMPSARVQAAYWDLQYATVACTGR